MPRIAFIIATPVIGIALSAPAAAQQSRLGEEFANERAAFAESCTGTGSPFAKVGNCAYELFTGHPLHVAVGSLPPQNGFGTGGAFVYHWTPRNWRVSLDTDAVASSNQSWRTGAYLTAVWIRRPKIHTQKGPPTKGEKEPAIQEQPVFHVYTENSSLNKLQFFGVGPNTSDAARSFFGMRETIAGANLIWPVGQIWRPLNMSLFTEINGRFVDIRGHHGDTSPSLEQLYTPVTAPGLASHPGYAQLGQGIQIRPLVAGNRIRLDYSVRFQEWVSSGAAPSFRRFITNLQHEYDFYGTERSLKPLPHNGPDDCSTSPEKDAKHACPPLLLPPTGNTSRDFEGRINVSLYIAESFLASGQSVPFYYQPTLGGSDINGNFALGSYQDYRFRGPNAILFRASFEHTIIPRFPLGVAAMIDEGKVALDHGDVNFSHLRHSYSAGLTLRAGGLPLIYLLFSWGGHEGMRTSARMDPSLLGGATRPSYY